MDLQISNGIIDKIDSKLSNSHGFDEVKLDNLHLSEGWFDSSVSLGEPGFEDRETISNGLEVAGRSGFTAIALQPNSYPIIDNQSQINFVKNKAFNSATALYPIGALTKSSDGQDLAELFDMQNSGAIAFGDYNKAIELDSNNSQRYYDRALFFKNLKKDDSKALEDYNESIKLAPSNLTYLYGRAKFFKDEQN